MPKILAIDDKPDNLGYLRMVLNKILPEATVLTVLSGQEGIKIAKEEQPDVILLDIVMPDMSGYEACEKLKAEEATRHIPLIMITAIDTSYKNRVRALNLGADAFLAKPIQEVELAAQINAMLRIKRAEDALRQENDHLEERIQARTRELKVLLREINHRVRNNMQAISSLLRLQSEKFTENDHLKFFRDVENRIKSLALIHEMLYQSEDFTKINFSEYVINLIYKLLSSYRVPGLTITPQIHVEQVVLGIDTAIPCGLLINELVSNSLKHAFPEHQTGEITVCVQPVDNVYEMIISDNGIGLPESIDFRQSETLGFALAMGWVRQLQAEIELDRSAGTRFRITFQQLRYKNQRIGD